MNNNSILLETLASLTAAIIFVPLAKRLGLGVVLGYLIAGCVIGPWGLKVITNTDEVMKFAEIGVILMLFLIGLSFDPKQLWQLRTSLFLGGGLQMMMCGLVLSALLFFSPLAWQTMLLIGMTLALSSTAITLQSLNEYNLSKRRIGREIFAILLWQDMAAIPLVALIPLLTKTDDTLTGSQIALTSLKIIGILLFVILLGRYIGRPLLRILAKFGPRETFSAFALLLILGFGELLQLAGLSMAMGAFLAGMLFASSEYRLVLESDIESFKGLLLGLFFISVGMSINFGLLFAHFLFVVGLLFAFSLLKLVTLFFCSFLLKIAKQQRWLFAALLAQGSEFAFLVFALANQAKLLSDFWSDVLTLIVALSMALTPLFVLLANYLSNRWEEHHRKNKHKDDVDELEQVEQPKVIIAGYGRFGQIAGQLLLANKIPIIILDQDPNNIEILRKVNDNVFFGDATRLDILETAGANKAHILINAIDNLSASLKLMQIVNQHFPHLQVIARATDLRHYYHLKHFKVNYIVRELFESSLLIGRRALELLGDDPYKAKEKADIFRRFHNKIIEKEYPHYRDTILNVITVKHFNDLLEQRMALEQKKMAIQQRAWPKKAVSEKTGHAKKPRRDR